MIQTTTESALKEAIQDKMETSFLRRASIKKSKLAPDMNISKALDENIFVFGHIMLDLHEAFNIEEIEYEPLTELELFHTPKEVVEYIFKKANK